MNMTRYLAVVPAYNEAATVGRVVRSIRDALPFFDVLVVNDGSTDATAAEAPRRAPSSSPIPTTWGSAARSSRASYTHSTTTTTTSSRWTATASTSRATYRS